MFDYRRRTSNFDRDDAGASINCAPANPRTARVEGKGMEQDRTQKSLDILGRMIKVLLAKKDGLYPPELADKRVRQLEEEAWKIKEETDG